MQRFSQKKGSVLILTLWMLMFLTVFAVTIGLKIRQRATLLSRIEKRSQLHLIAAAGVKKAIAALRFDWQRHAGIYTSFAKFYRHNNNDVFRAQPVGYGSFDVSYQEIDRDEGVLTQRFGVVDEERKMNINLIDRGRLRRLFERIILEDQDKAYELADAIIEWREPGKTKLESYFSEDYYNNLELPYKPKNEPFEIIDELLLVRGFNPEAYALVKPFITIYGDGQINVNTASREVLIALGLSEILVDKLLSVRSGADRVESTDDDYVFYKTFDIGSELEKFVELSEDELKLLERINANGFIKTNSSYYSITSIAKLDNDLDTHTVDCIYNPQQNSIEYWREK